MNKAETIDALDDLVKQHASGTRGHIGQGDYKEDLFKLFVSSYQAEPIHGDVIAQSLQDRPGYIDGTPESVILRDLTRMWDEWLYAWNRHHRN